VGRLESDFAEMYAALERIGFIEIIEESFRKGRTPDLDKLATRGGLVVEAIKPR